MAYLDTKDVYELFNNGVAHLHITDIDFLPRADVEEVHHGKWVYCWPDVKRCSCCGYEVSFAQAELYQGCPICRAKMDRKGE